MDRARFEELLGMVDPDLHILTTPGFHITLRVLRLSTPTLGDSGRRIGGGIEEGPSGATLRHGGLSSCPATSRAGDGPGLVRRYRR